MSELAQKVREAWWRKAVADAQEPLLQRIEALEAQIAEANRIIDVQSGSAVSEYNARRDALLEAAKAVCHHCRRGIPLEKWKKDRSRDVWHPKAGDDEYKACPANSIHKLLES